MSDLGGLVYLSQRCSSPVLSLNFVPPGKYFCDSLTGATCIDPVTPTISVRSGGYAHDVQGDLSVGMENLFPWLHVTLNLRKEMGMFSHLRACRWVEGIPLLPKHHTQGTTVFVIPLYPWARMEPSALLGD
jgi:hypothetical protein